MRNRTRNENAALLCAVALLIFAGVSIMSESCASQAASPADQAEIVYGQLAVTYQATQTAIVDLRAKHLVTDAQWNQFDLAQHAVAAATPPVSSLLRAWKAGGVKPADYDARFLDLVAAFQAVQNIYAKVKVTP